MDAEYQQQRDGSEPASLPSRKLLRMGSRLPVEAPMCTRCSTLLYLSCVRRRCCRSLLRLPAALQVGQVPVKILHACHKRQGGWIGMVERSPNAANPPRTIGV